MGMFDHLPDEASDSQASSGLFDNIPTEKKKQNTSLIGDIGTGHRLSRPCIDR